MQIDWLTVSAQLVNFLILVWLLQRFLYRPVLQAMARREKQIGARLAEAQSREEQAEAERRRYREQTEAFERALEQKLAEARESAEKEKRMRLDEARRDLETQRKQWREELRREQEDMCSTLRRELVESAADIARRALADLADVALERQIAQTLLRRLEGLSEEEHKRFARTDGPVRLASSFPLDDETRKRLRAAIAAPSGMEFSRDPQLICGIALAGNAHRLDWNIQDYVGDAERRICAQLAISPRGHEDPS